MRKTLTTIAALAILVPSGAIAAPAPAPKTTVSVIPSTATGMLSGAALNAATAADRTATISISSRGTGWSKLRFGIAYTYSAGSTITAQFTCQYTTGGSYYRRTTRNCSSGDCAAFLWTDTHTHASASVNFELEYDVRGCASVQLLLGGAGVDGSDLVTTEALLIVGD